MGVMKLAYLIFDLFVMFNPIFFIPKPADHTELDSSALNRKSFPVNFTFGVASSAYQYEGAYEEDGKGPSIWDTYTHRHPERIDDRSNGDVANDQYHHYKEDVALVKDMGFDAYRFSISWPRILPSGKLSGGVNKKGIQYYNDLIDEILSKGLQPYAAIFHWDVPQTIEDEYGGFLSSRIVEDFKDYADLCYREFGDRVKHWITINEPSILATLQYDLGAIGSGCFESFGTCFPRNSTTIPYVLAHNQLLAHAAAVKIYKEKYQSVQKGQIGLTLLFNLYAPLSQTKADKDAAERANEFNFGWFMDPVTYGEYPKSMQSLCGDRLPKFTKLQSDTLKGSYDFVGLNYYTTFYTANSVISPDAQQNYHTDCRCSVSEDKSGAPLGPKSDTWWPLLHPKGILDVLRYTKEKYNSPTIYITENGIGGTSNSSLSLEEVLADPLRIEYHRRHLSFVVRAIDEGIDLKGYFAWSLLDAFEWFQGYTTPFGLYYVDPKTMKRYPKHSSIWFKKFLKN
uniref:Acyl-glucose-dependent anthocyanin glucosyltransferase n=1 Tax=Delphinium grandiflorum TaxID=85439 RepID=U6C7C6_DELGR|nr:acyl-glucose-dependent anthocyanin glucosyltransferase [Delphinium grandiflorum]